MPQGKEGGSGLSGWKPLSDEERTRHESLFFSQGPIEGLLPGEKARELFLRSGLPIHILSKIWNLVDIPHDNMLDHSEFTAALHLIQCYLRGHKLPLEVPECIRPAPKEEVRVTTIKLAEFVAYKRLFKRFDLERKGHMKGAEVCPILQTSQLPPQSLARIWNLSDIDRDTKLSADEFLIACHLVRFCKKGNCLDGPVNVLSLLPHKLPKTDLAAKRAKLADLEVRKKRLMVLKEKRKTESVRETKRLELWREKLKLLKLRHQVVEDIGVVPPSAVEEEALRVQSVEDSVFEMEAVAHRLTKEHERVRQETAHAIVDEQKLSKEVEALQEEAERLRQKRKRNSIIKDLDPFHQLYEEQKEEKLTGVASPKKQYNIHIPPAIDPFEKGKLDYTFVSGQDLFECFGDESKVDTNQEKSESTRNPWLSSINQEVAELTQGFDDNFIEVWGQPEGGPPESNRNLLGDGLGSPFGSPLSWEKDKDFGFSFEDENDLVFRTVPVTAEEDELWCSLPEAVLTQTEQLHYLHNKLEANSKQLEGLNQQGAQLVFRNPSDYEVYAREQQDKEEYSSRLDYLADQQRAQLRKEYGNPRYGLSRRFSYHGDEGLPISSQDPKSSIRKHFSLVGKRHTDPLSKDTDSYIASVRERLERIRARSVERLKQAEELAKTQSASESYPSVQEQQQEPPLQTDPRPKEAPSPNQTSSPLHRFSTSARGSVKQLIARRDSSRGSSDASGSDIEKALETADRSCSIKEVTSKRPYIQKRRSITRGKAVVDSDVVYSSVAKSDSDSRTNSVADHSNLSPQEGTVIKPFTSEEVQSSPELSSSDTDKYIESYPKVPQISSEFENNIKNKPHILGKPPDLIASTIHDIGQKKTNNSESLHTSVEHREKNSKPIRPQSVFEIRNFSDTSESDTKDSTQCIIRKKSPSLDKLARSEKAQSWSVGDPPPIPPPRKNRSPQKSKTPPKPKQPLLEIQSFSPRKKYSSVKQEVKRPLLVNGGLSSSVDSLRRISNVSLSSVDSVSKHSTVSSPTPPPVSSESEACSSALSTPLGSPTQSPRKPPRQYNSKKRAPLPPTGSPTSQNNYTELDPLPKKLDFSESEIPTQSPTREVEITPINSDNPVPPPRKRSSVKKAKVKLADTKKKFKTVDDQSGNVDSDLTDSKWPVKSHTLPPEKLSFSSVDSECEKPKTNKKPDLDILINCPDPETPSGDKDINNTTEGCDQADKMDAETRRMELERMRQGFYGRKTETPPSSVSNIGGVNVYSNTTHPHETNTYSTDLNNSNVTITNTADSRTQKASTVISIVDDGKQSPGAIAYENTLSKSVLNIRNDSPQHKPAVAIKADEFEDGFYDEEPVLKPADGTISKSNGNSKIVLDLDEHAYKPEFEMDTARCSDSDNSQNADFAMPHTSKIVLALDEDQFAGETTEYEAFLVQPLIDIDSEATWVNPTDNRFVDKANDDNANTESKVYLDLTGKGTTPAEHRAAEHIANPAVDYFSNTVEDQAMPVLQASNTKRSADLYLPSPTEKTSDRALRVSTGSTGSLSFSHTSSDRDSDLSENEGTFQATFEPRHDLDYQDADQFQNVARAATHDDSGIVLVSYQQRAGPPTPESPPKAEDKKNDQEALRSFVDFFSSGPSSPKKENQNKREDNKKVASSVSLTLKQPASHELLMEDREGEAMPPPLEPQKVGGVESGLLVTEGEPPPLPITQPPIPGSAPPLKAPIHITPMVVTSVNSSTTQHITLGSGPESEDKDIASGSMVLDPEFSHNQHDNLKEPDSLTDWGISSLANTSLPYPHTPPATEEETDLVGDANISMDPSTGLKKTGLSTPVEKAIQFVERTEPVIRIKKKNSKDNEPPDPERVALYQEIEQERHSILNELRMKPRRMTSWVSEEAEQETSSMSQSEKRYSERKKRQSQPNVVPTYTGSPFGPAYNKNRSTPSGPRNNTSSIGSTPYRVYGYKKPTDIDSRSIGNQEYTKKHWEDKLSEGDVRLFPAEPAPAVKTSISLDNFRSDVDTESISNLNHIKQHWEQKHEQQQIDKEQTNKYQEIKTSPSNNNNNYSYHSADDEVEYESAIDREIRLAQARELELQREKSLILQQVAPRSVTPTTTTTTQQEMPIHKVVPVLRVEKGEAHVSTDAVFSPTPAPRPPSYREMTEADRDSDLLKRESIIEREIREQQARESSLRHELHATSIVNKEEEQSEWERQEKEQERIVAHESIIEREIRLQKEREADIAREHGRPAPSQPQPIEPVYQYQEPETVREERLPSLPAAPPAQATHTPTLHQEPVPYHHMESNHVPHSPPEEEQPGVTYEVAIATQAHSGESFIARELREQREREEELRSRYKIMGLDMPTVASDTPYNMPEPQQPKLPMGIHVQPVSSIPAQQSGTYHREVKPFKDSVTVALTANERRPSIDSQNSSRSAASSHHQELPRQETPKGHTVQPFSTHDEEEVDSPSFRYMPQNETPIDREIRRAREMEESLRRERGLPVQADESRDMMLDIHSSNSSESVSRPNLLYRKGDEQGKGAMKRFASSRLQQEIEQEKRRECELKQTGMIQTLSEERVGEIKKYKEVIPEGGLPVRSPLTPKTPTSKTPTRTPSTPSNQEHLSAMPTNQEPVTNGSAPTTPSPVVTTPTAVRQRPEPAVLRRYSEHTQLRQDHGGQRSQHTPIAESKIEQELREMRERELELRAQREVIKGGNPQAPIQNGGDHHHEAPSPTYYPSQPRTPTPEPQISYRPKPPTENPRIRRKSALAEQWERKFGQQNS